MKIYHITSFLLLITISVFPSLVTAQYEIMSTSRLLEELSLNSGMARELEPALKANIALKNAYTSELQDINRDNTSYKNAKAGYDRDLTAHNAEVDRFNAACSSGTFTQAELDRCDTMERDLAAEQAVLNERRNTLEETRLALNQRQTAFNNKERERAQAAEQLLTLYDDYNRNIESIMAILGEQDLFRACSNRPSPEAAHQCMQSAWDNRN